MLTGFRNLASVSFTVVNNNAFLVAQIDNIVVDETSLANLSISKTDGVTTAIPGGSVTYTIVASNAGPNNASGATVADTFPASLTCTWTCVGAGGGTCTASGSGNLNDTVNLPAGGSTTYTASCAISAAATGTLSNTATLAAPGGATDPNPGNNSATDTDNLVPQADLAITKSNGLGSVVQGGTTTYTITASNNGPSAVGATVADTFPATLTCTWTCAGAGGGTCAASGTGSINDTVNLPVGGSVTYTANCAIAVSATGRLINTATVAAPVTVTDPNSANNSATDTDTLAAADDGDGAPAAVEDAAPSNGDGNFDGISDRAQGNVASLPAAAGGTYLTLAVSGGCGQINGVSTTPEATFGDDPAFDYPVGLVGFNLPCASATITVYYHGQSAPLGEAYRKRGPTTPANPATVAFYTLPGAIFGSANGVPTATFALTDGALGDDDTGANPRGRIVDPGGPARAAPASIPTLGPWSLAILILHGLWFGLAAVRRRSVEPLA